MRLTGLALAVIGIWLFTSEGSVGHIPHWLVTILASYITVGGATMFVVGREREESL